MRMFALLIVAFAGLVALMADMDRFQAETGEEPDPIIVEPAAPVPAAPMSAAPLTPTYSNAVQFERGTGGHFYTDAVIGGTSVRFLVDTGATGIALTEADARRLGLPFHTTEFAVVGRQVSGVVRGKRVLLPDVRVGGKSVRDVEAVIIEGGTMNLLGQSFLTRAGTIEMDGDTMVLR